MGESSSTLLLVFRVGPITLALPAEAVADVALPPAHITPLPGGAPATDGLFQHHHAVGAVIDLRRRLGLDPGAGGRLVTTRLGGTDYGFRVDQVVGLVEPERLLPLPADVPRDIFSCAFWHQGSTVLCTEPARLLRLSAELLTRISHHFSPPGAASHHRHMDAPETGAARRAAPGRRPLTPAEPARPQAEASGAAAPPARSHAPPVRQGPRTGSAPEAPPPVGRNRNTAAKRAPPAHTTPATAPSRRSAAERPTAGAPQAPNHHPPPRETPPPPSPAVPEPSPERSALPELGVAVVLALAAAAYFGPWWGDATERQPAIPTVQTTSPYPWEGEVPKSSPVAPLQWGEPAAAVPPFWEAEGPGTPRGGAAPGETEATHAESPASPGEEVQQRVVAQREGAMGEGPTGERTEGGAHPPETDTGAGQGGSDNTPGPAPGERDRGTRPYSPSAPVAIAAGPEGDPVARPAPEGLVGASAQEPLALPRETAAEAVDALTSTELPRPVAAATVPVPITIEPVPDGIRIVLEAPPSPDADQGHLPVPPEEAPLALEAGAARPAPLPIDEAGCEEEAIECLVVHTVVRGDTLWAIAARYIGNPFRYPELARASNIADPDLIHPGQRVYIVRRRRP